MDVIDATDFVYTPLLALEPQYLAYVQLYMHSTVDDENLSAREDEREAVDHYWRPHEEALMSVTIPPRATKVFCASDYLCCPEYSSLYAAVQVRQGLCKE